MKILVIADPHIPVPPNQYGGTERMAGFFCEAMSRRGHCVHLLAGFGSNSYGGRVITHRAPSLGYFSRAFRKIWFQILSLWAARDVDLIINFGRLDYLWALFRTRVPILCRLANPVAQSEIDLVLAQRRKLIRFLGISQSQMSGLEPRELIQVIYNPTDIERFHLQEAAAEPRYLAFLGRITSNKGADTAIEVAKRTGLKLKIAGNISNEEGGREFFETRIRPQLGEQIEYVGPVDDAAKQRLLGGAQAMLFPIRWNEPFGIVMIESLACGTPVIATRCASTPEVIRHGHTGFLCDSTDELVQAVKRIGEIRRKDCRAEVERRFTLDVITDQHETLLIQLIEESKWGRT
jgi:glycosyltransferase involved in cell wall biosynthesis